MHCLPLITENEEEDDSDQNFPNTAIQDPKYYTKFGPFTTPKCIADRELLNGCGLKIAIVDSYDAESAGGFQLKHDVFHHSDIKIEDCTHGSSNKHSSHALMCAAIAVGKNFDGCRREGEDNVTCIYPGGIAPQSHATVFLVNHQDQEHESLYEALDKVKEGNYDVLSMSFRKAKEPEEFDKKIKDIRNRNTIIVAAAGNGGGWEGVQYPALHKDIICVGSLDTYLNKSAFSPPSGVDILFYGEVMVPVRDSTKCFLKFSTGTSMAAPGIAGMICLILQCAMKHGYDKNKFKNNAILIDILKKLLIDEENNYCSLKFDQLFDAFNNKLEFEKLYATH